MLFSSVLNITVSYTGFEDKRFYVCSCQSPTPSSQDQDDDQGDNPHVDRFIACWLIQEGFFPASPSRAVNAYSIQFLRFTLHISTRSGVAVNALADALRGFYAEQGLYLLNDEVRKCHIFLLSP